VSALVTIYTPWPADNWNELDIEHLGATPDRVQFNTMVYLGEPVTPPASASVTPTQFPELVDLGFDASADFHEYEVEWTNTYVRFSVDGQVLHSFTEQVEKLGLAQNILLTIWASSSPDWAGAVTAETSGAKAVYDWIEVYEQQQ
jgi:endo-1,3-1,4-beta-glycanase ExoK